MAKHEKVIFVLILIFCLAMSVGAALYAGTRVESGAGEWIPGLIVSVVLGVLGLFFSFISGDGSRSRKTRVGYIP